MENTEFQRMSTRMREKLTAEPARKIEAPKYTTDFNGNILVVQGPQTKQQTKVQTTYAYKKNGTTVLKKFAPPLSLDHSDTVRPTSSTADKFYNGKRFIQ